MRFFSDDSTDKLTKADILKREADKKAVRAYEQAQSKAGRSESVRDPDTKQASEHQLDALWKKVRDFLTDVDEHGAKISPRNKQKPARIRFMTACEMYADPKGNPSHLPFEKVKTAFNAAYMLPIPSDAELKQLFRALEAYYNEDMQIVNWSKILDAITHREAQSYLGIFPKMLVKLSAAEKTGMSEKEMEAQKELQKMQEDRLAREEAKEKAMAQLKKADLQASKSMSPIKSKEPSRNDLKKQERELALQKEEDRLLKIEQDKIEKEAVKKESEEFSKRLNAIIAKFRAAGNEQQVVNTFRLFDKDGNGKLNLKEFTVGMLQSKIHCNPDEVLYVY